MLLAGKYRVNIDKLGGNYTDINSRSIGDKYNLSVDEVVPIVYKKNTTGYNYINFKSILLSKSDLHQLICYIQDNDIIVNKSVNVQTDKSVNTSANNLPTDKSASVNKLTNDPSVNKLSTNKSTDKSTSVNKLSTDKSTNKSTSVNKLSTDKSTSVNKLSTDKSTSVNKLSTSGLINKPVSTNRLATSEPIVEITDKSANTLTNKLITHRYTGIYSIYTVEDVEFGIYSNEIELFRDFIVNKTLETLLPGFIADKEVYFDIYRDNSQLAISTNLDGVRIREERIPDLAMHLLQKMVSIVYIVENTEGSVRRAFLTKESAISFATQYESQHNRTIYIKTALI